MDLPYVVLPLGTRSWSSRYAQMCASYLTIQRTTLVGTLEIRFRTLVYEQLETRETLTLTPNTHSNIVRHFGISLLCVLFSHLTLLGPTNMVADGFNFCGLHATGLLDLFIGISDLTWFSIP